MITNMLTDSDKQWVRKEIDKQSDRLIQVIEDVGNNIIRELSDKIEDVDDMVDDHDRRIAKLEAET